MHFEIDFSIYNFEVPCANNYINYIALLFNLINYAYIFFYFTTELQLSRLINNKSHKEGHTLIA